MKVIYKHEFDAMDKKAFTTAKYLEKDLCWVVRSNTSAVKLPVTELNKKELDVMIPQRTDYNVEGIYKPLLVFIKDKLDTVVLEPLPQSKAYMSSIFNDEFDSHPPLKAKALLSTYDKKENSRQTYFFTSDKNIDFTMTLPDKVVAEEEYEVYFRNTSNMEPYNILLKKV